MALEITGKISAYPVRDGMQLDFMEYDPKGGIDIGDAWYGNYKNLLFEIYSKFKGKPVVITVDLANTSK